MSFVLIIVVTNWMGLIPGWDSIGFWEYKPHFYAEKEIKEIEADLAVAEAEGEEAVAAFIASLEDQYHVEVHLENGHLTHESEEELLHEIEHVIDLENRGDATSGRSIDACAWKLQMRTAIE